MTDKFDDIIRGLQAQQPTLENADELTDMIMASLPDQQQTPAIAPKGPRVLYLIRNISSAAAMFLIALFVWQFNEEPELTPSKFTQTASYSEPVYSFDCESPRECAEKYMVQRRRNAEYRANTIEILTKKYHEND